MDLATYYQIVYFIIKKSNLTFTELEEMMPFERDLFFEMIIAEEERKRELAESG